MKPETFVIVGANLCGGTAAASLREEGFEGRIVLIGEERLPPYERPPLAKEYLRGEQPLEAGFVRPPTWYEEHAIDARFGVRAERLDLGPREVVLAGGERLRFDKLLIATGARNRRFPIPGLDLPNVLDLRTVDDCAQIRAAARRGGRAVVVGMGFIGSEVAASLRSLGVEITAVEPFETPLLRVLGPEIGRVVADVHRDNSVELVLGDSVERFEGDGRVEAVVTKEGRRIECDFAVVGVGVQPNAEIAEGTGLELNNGIVWTASSRPTRPGSSPRGTSPITITRFSAGSASSITTTR